MWSTLLQPLIAATVLGALVTAAHGRMRPVMAVRAVTVTLVAVAAAGIATIWIVSLGYVAHLPRVEIAMRWCARAFGVHQQIPWWIGVPGVVLAVAGFVRIRRVVRSYRRLLRHHCGPVQVTQHDKPFAFTLPGRGGQVVVSTGLVAILDERECAVVLAHEEAHARHRHDRYLLIAQLAAAAVPPLRHLSRRLQFSLERWADEAAVAQCGDRRFVARTLGKVALSSVTPAGAMSFAGLGVPARVKALLSPPALPLRTSVQVALFAAIGLTSTLAAMQLHHLVRLVTALCPG